MEERRDLVRLLTPLQFSVSSSHLHLSSPNLDGISTLFKKIIFFFYVNQHIMFSLPYPGRAVDIGDKQCHCPRSSIGHILSFLHSQTALGLNN